MAFLDDMGPRPAGATLDRIDNDSSYSKENCRWASRKQQTNNRSTNRIIEFNGKRQTLSQWSDELGVKASLLWHRVKKHGPSGLIVVVKKYRPQRRRAALAQAREA